jgi:hypothetical protein
MGLPTRDIGVGFTLARHMHIACQSEALSAVMRRLQPTAWLSYYFVCYAE